MPADRVELSVIIVTCNSAPYLERCLDSLGQHLTGISQEICVVDNASADVGPALVQQRFPNVHLIINKRNLGFSAAVNQGLRATAGSFVLWLNPDTELVDDGFQELLQYIRDNPSVGILGSQVVDSDGKRQLSCRSFPSYSTALFHRYSLLTRLFPWNPGSREYLHSDWNAVEVREVDWVSGACLFHRREVSDQLGGLDEKFFLYCEDVDFCLRAKQRGWSIRYHPAAKVIHHIGISSQQLPYRSIIQRHRSMWRYYLKHFRRNLVKDFLVAMAIWIRAGFIMLKTFFMGGPSLHLLYHFLINTGVLQILFSLTYDRHRLTLN